MSKPERISILYLDDEEHNLSAFKATFRRIHNIRTAGTSDEALEMIEEEEPQIIIADQRMPKVTGIEFFHRVYQKHPDPLRVLLTAYTSSQTVIDAVNKGKIDHYLVKPWDRDMMEKTIESGYKSYMNKIELKRKNQELFRINNELNRFVYSVSHDLRAPLLSMLGLVDLCKNEEDQLQVEEYYHLMEQSIHKMDDYIKSMLQYYRNLKTEVIIEKVELSEMVREICEPLENYSKYVSFDIQVSSDVALFTDRIRLKIALNNLISNAVKYGSKEIAKDYTVTIKANMQPSQTKISVMDEGKGIGPEQLKRIFDIFYSANKEVESTGLGLYLVRQSIQKIKGSVDVRSKLDVGTEFELTIPDLKSAN